MAWLFDPPGNYDLPVSLGGDIIVTFKNRVPGSSPAEYENYPNNVAVKLAITNGDNVIEADAVITDEDAVCRIESEVADTIADGSLWRVIVSVTNGDKTDDITALNGTVVRADGA